MRIRKYRTLQYLPQTRGSHHTSDAVCRKQGNQGKPGNQETEKPGTVTGNQGEETRRETRKPGNQGKPEETRGNQGNQGRKPETRRNQGQSPITGLRNGAMG